jgi:uncharacterized OB-fold protein
MSEYQKPLPYPDAETKPYWEWAKKHELRMQRCADCAELRFPPGPMCPACHSMRDEWVPMSGTGTIYSWVVVHPPVLPAFQADAPYSVVLVQLDDHPHLRLVPSGDANGEPVIRLAGEPVGDSSREPRRVR